MGAAEEPPEGEDQGEITPPKKGDSTAAPGHIYAEIAAQINQYTDRPDLLLEVIEKHDPGFIKAMNDEARHFSKKYRVSRFRFGRFQSYSTLFVQIAVAAAIIGIIYVMAQERTLSTWHLVGFAIFYAITQSGPAGFARIAAMLANMMHGRSGREE